VTDGPIVLLDATNLAMRSFHAASNTGMAVGGEATGPLVIFVNSLSKLLADEKPGRFVACWDSGGSQYRETVYPSYKLARRQAAATGFQPHLESFRLIKEFLSLSWIPQWRKEGVEADDLIAAAHRRSDGRKLILSSDKDLFQLLDEDTEQIRFTGAVKSDRWDPARVRHEYGCTPDQLAMVMALSGDVSDGVPGLPGIGPKRAVKMLQAAEWNWNTMLNTLSAKQENIAEMCRQLVDLTWFDVPVPVVPVWNPLPRFTGQLAASGKLLEFCDTYRLNNIRHRLESRTLWW
jgi:DNA polymerase-1